MIKEKYLNQIRDTVHKFNRGKDLHFFIYGSSLVRERFGDVDIGVEGEVHGGAIGALKEEFEESTLPYFVDVVDFSKVSKEFRENVLQQKILWLTRSPSN